MRCLIVDDHTVVSAGLSAIVKGKFPDWSVEVTGTVRDAVAVIGRNDINPVDLILLDIGLNGESGLDLLTYLETADLELSPRSVVISGAGDQDIIDQSITLGAGAYLQKDGDVDQLFQAIRHVMDLPEEPKPLVLEELLTERQRLVFGLVLHAYSNKKIASTLDISVGTVKNHMYALMRAFQVDSRAELVLLAAKNGFVKPDMDTLKRL